MKEREFLVEYNETPPICITKIKFATIFTLLQTYFY